MKTKIITLLLLISLPLGAVSTTFSSNGIKISDYNFSLDFDSLSFSYNKNGFQVGKINLFSLSELLYPFDYIWEGKVERNRTNNQNGISYNSDNVDFFLLSNNRFSVGSRVNLSCFSLSFIRYKSGNVGNSLYSDSLNRGGGDGENIILKYNGKHILFKTVFSFSNYNPLAIMYTFAVNYKYLTLSSSYGKFNSFEEELNPKLLVLTGDINNKNLNISVTYSLGEDPYIGGSFRTTQLINNVRFRYEKLILKSEYKISFSSKGKYSKEHQYEVFFSHFGFKWNNFNDVSYIFKKDYFRFESNLKTFAITISIDKEKFSLYLFMNSDFKIRTSVSLKL